MRGRLILGGVTALLLVAGCATGLAGHPTAADSQKATATSDPVSSTAVTTTPAPVTSTEQGTAVRPPLATPVCTVRDLDVVLAGEEGTAGTMYRGLVFTNTGGRVCTIQGFPGVSFVAGEDGHQVGAAAIRQGEKGAAVTLRPGAAATAPVGFRNIDMVDTEICLPTPVLGLRVHPPYSRRAEFVPFATTGCAGEVPGGQLIVLTVHAGTALS